MGRDDRAVAVLAGRGWFGDDRVALFESPDCILRFQGGRALLSSGGRVVASGDPLRLIEARLNEGCTGVGFFGYEFFHHLQEDFNARQKPPDGFPDACFAFFSSFDTISLEELEAPSGANGVPVESNVKPEEFMAMVDAVRRYISAGDVYQVNISQMFTFPFRWTCGGFLRRFYSAQPVPYACCLDFGDFSVISGSMELFLRRTGRTLTTGPIKGTRQRASDPDEDRQIREELRQNEKERAENVMIVDLMRNDLGRVCEFGSVRVGRLFEVETYSTLHQMVSEVSGRLRPGVSLGDIIRASFPPGSVTGAPKRRALEIIEELEPHRRGPYCGAVGLLLPGGDFVLSVGIRTVGVRGSSGYYWAGGGITWGSVPEMEYGETLVKARAVLRAIGG